MTKLTKTIPPKRGPNPQGFKNGADVDIFGFGNDDFQYGSGKVSYTFDGKKSSITPSISGSVVRSKGKTVKKGFDRIGLKGDYKLNKKTKLKAEVSRNVHGDKDYRGMIAAEYKNKNKEGKISIDDTGRVNLKGTYRFNKGGGDFDPEGKGYDYKTAKKDHYFNIFRDAPGGAKPHGVSRDRKTGKLLKGRKHKTFNLGVSVDENLGYGLKKKGKRYYTEKLKRGVPAGKYKDMSKFSKGGCPFRENGVKSDIKGISNIQVKGQKFIGTK